MPRNFDIRQQYVRLAAWVRRDPRVPVRAVLGVLLAVNLIAVWFVFHPLGGSLADLSAQAVTLERQIQAKQRDVKNLQSILERVRKAREAGEKFETAWFLGRRTAYSNLVTELGDAAKNSGVKEREKSYNVEPIEGSGNLSLLTVNANYEGSYAELVRFVNQLDRSQRLLIIDALQAQPLQGTNALSIALKMNAILREEGL